MKDQTRNLNPHKPAQVAMWIYSREYVAQHGGSMDFWDNLDEARKRHCRQMVSAIAASREETMAEQINPEKA